MIIAQSLFDAMEMTENALSKLRLVSWHNYMSNFEKQPSILGPSQPNSEIWTRARPTLNSTFFCTLKYLYLSGS